jgi:hypothetical protein
MLAAELLSKIKNEGRQNQTLFSRRIGVWCWDARLFARGIDHAAARADVHSVFFAKHGLMVEEFHVRLDAERRQTIDVKREKKTKKPNLTRLGFS